MSLKFEIKSLEEVDEALRSLYEAHGDGFRLSVEGIDPADELKEALRKEREETKAERQKRLAMEEAQKSLEEKQAKEKGEFKTLWEKEQAEKATLKEELNAFRQTVQDKEKSLAIASIIGAVTKDEAKAEALRSIVASYVQINDAGESFYSKGGIEIAKTALIDEIKSRYPFLVDGSQAQGGQGNGNNGNAGSVQKKFDEMSGAELSELRKSDPQTYERLKSEYNSKAE